MFKPNEYSKKISNFSLEDFNNYEIKCKDFIKTYYKTEEYIMEYDQLNVVNWCMMNSNLHNGLKLVAEKYLIIEPTEVVCENLFYHGTLIDSDLRYNLNEDSIESM